MTGERIWHIARRILCLALFLLLFVWGLENVRQIPLLCRGWSLRYEESFDEVQKQQAKRYFIEHSEAYKGLWVNFWTAGKSRFTAEFAETEADCILFDGDASRVKTERFISGDYPGELDRDGVAVSAGLSWLLWGSLDTLGKEVRVDGATKVVCGVYEGDAAAALMGGNRQTAWRNAEVYSDVALSREELIQFLSASLIGEPDALVDGEGIAGLMGLLQYLPLFAAAVFVAVRLLRMRCGHTGKNIRRGVVLLALFVFALLLPQLLLQLPPWLIPTKWSDLNFWSGLVETLSGYVRDWFALHPTGDDVAVKQCMVQQAFYVVGMLFCLIGIFWGSGRASAVLPDEGEGLREVRDSAAHTSMAALDG